MEVTFLSASDKTPLTKTFINENNVLTVASYPHVLTFSSKSIKIKDIRELAPHLKDPKNCLLKGNLKKPLCKERRAGSTDPDALTQLLCLDVDGISWASNSIDVLKKIGLEGVAHIEQLSASAGIQLDRGYSAHIFIMLKKPVSPAFLKLWVTDLNLQFLEDDIKLNRAGTSLKWPLDITVNQNDKLIYTAPPICIGFEPPKLKRVIVHKGTGMPDIEHRPIAVIKSKTTVLMNTRRKDVGLPRRSHRVEGELLLNPDECTVTGVKQDRGFTYLNLNGGDSWGYYYPDDNFEILYNFKGEPNTRLKDVAPTFYKDLVGDTVERTEGMEYAIGLDVVSDRFMRITYDRDADIADITFTGARANAFDFLKQHGQPKPDFIPTWSSFCDFNSGETVDFIGRRINRYIPTGYMRLVQKSDSIPPVIDAVISHVFAYDTVVIEHFLNWLAVIFQHRIMTLTAWVIGGTQGTGKGILFDKIISPVLGKEYCNKVSLAHFEKEFNGFLEDCLVLFIDEIQASDVKKHSVAMANIKKDMANDRIDIRRMRRDVYVIDNYCNFIFGSNKFDALEIDPDDRRFNVSPRQERPLKEVVDLELIEKRIEKELQDFANYIMTRRANVDIARRILTTDERHRLQAATENTTMSIATKIRKGDFAFFVECFTSAKDLSGEFELATRMKNPPTFRKVMDYLYDHRNKECRIPRDFLAVLFYYTADVAKNTPHAFTKFLGYHGFDMKVITFEGRPTRGIIVPRIEVKDEATWLQATSTELKVVKK